MRSGRVIELPTRHIFGANMLKRVIAQQGFHEVDRGGYKSDVLRIIPGSVPEEVLREFYIVFIGRVEESIAKVEDVRRVAEVQYDLLLSPFGEFNQIGSSGPIIELGVHLLYGPVHHKPEYRSRASPRDCGAYKPSHFVPHSA